MKQEDKELLLKDLCARLPYGVKVSILGSGAMELKTCINSTIGWYFDIEGAPTDFGIDEIKPYLRPMSSMTEEERNEFYDIPRSMVNHKSQDWLLERHFDYRRLIEKGLAIEVTEENNPYN